LRTAFAFAGDSGRSSFVNDKVRVSYYDKRGRRIGEERGERSGRVRVSVKNIINAKINVPSKYV